MSFHDLFTEIRIAEVDGSRAKRPREASRPNQIYYFYSTVKIV